MAMPGGAVLAMWWDIDAPQRVEFEHWHSSEHFAERLAIPGFRRGSRWSASSSPGAYFVMYELDGLDVLDSAPYLERVNHPTPWSTQVMAGFRNMVRSRCLVSARAGAGLGQAMLTVRLSPQPGRGDALRSALAREVLPALAARPGLTGAHLLENVAPPSSPQTAEQRLRGGDAMADWVMLVGGYDQDAVAGLAGRELGEGELARLGAAAGVVACAYRLAHCVVPEDFDRL